MKIWTAVQRGSLLVALLVAASPLAATGADFALLGLPSKTLVAISSDGTRILFDTSGGGELWDAGTSTPVSSLAGFPADARVTDMSADGSVIVGNAKVPPSTSYDEGFVWSGGVTTYLALDGSAGPLVDVVSGDGSTVFGRDQGVLFRWSGGALVALERLEDDGFPGTHFSEAVYDASFDGSVAVGRNVLTTSSCFQCPWAVRWDGAEVTELDSLISPPPPNPLVSQLMTALAVSDDGSIVTGEHRSAGSGTYRLAPVGLEILDNPGGTDASSTVRGISGGGGRIVGRSNLTGGSGSAGLWDPAHGFRFLEDALLDDYGVVVPAGYELLFATLVSGDGSTLVGNLRPAGGGTQELWIAHLSQPQTVPLMSATAVTLLAVWVAAVGAGALRRR